MRIGAQVVAYNQEFLLEYALRSIYSHCDVIHVTASDRPWNYSKDAQKYVKSDRTFEILDQFPDPDHKLVIEKDYWPTEESQRNHSAKVLERLGCDYIFIVDPDEVYDDQALVGIRDRLIHDTHQVTHRIFWKTFKWRLWPDVLPQTFYRVKPDLYFHRGRLIRNSGSKSLLPVVCHHFSYVMPPERMREKLATFLHAPEIKSLWFTNVWSSWKPGMKDLHPVNPSVWKEALPYNPNERHRF